LEGHVHTLAECRWEDGDPGAHCDMDGWLRPSDVINLVRVVNSTYIQNDSRTRKQVKGLPMGVGTNPAPHLADTHCYDKESASMDTLCTTDLNLARTFFGSYRYIDDTLSIDNPHFDSFVRLTGDHEPSNPPIYPDFLLPDY